MLLPHTAPSVDRSVSLPDLIGNTPLLRLDRISSHLPGVDVLAKAEWFNPGGSVKDRAALFMLRRGEETGALGKGQTILEATSGNTGIAFAMLGAWLGYPVVVCLPESASSERKRILRAYGAEIVETSALEGIDGSIAEARRLHREAPGKYFYPDQYGNDANWRAHYRTTAHEIWHQTEGGLTHFVCGLGTSGTFVGTSRRLKELAPEISCVSVQPDGPLHGLEGWKHMPSSTVPEIYDPSIADAEKSVVTEDAYAMMGRLAREEGLFVSPSAAGALVASLELAEEIGRGVVVTVFPDSRGFHDKAA